MHLKAKWFNTEHGAAVRVFFEKEGVENLTPTVEVNKEVLYEKRGAEDLLSETGDEAAENNKMRTWPFGNWVIKNTDIEKDSLQEAAPRFHLSVDEPTTTIEESTTTEGE